tara:strand:+ start:570 stop:980 length:411 start_codon:yes stop_codon:yes gene_type:complete
MFIEFTLFNLLFIILWFFGIIMLILLLINRKCINKWLMREKKNRIKPLNMNDYYKLDLGEKKYYYLKSSLEYLKNILKEEGLELVVIKELNKIVIIHKDEKINVEDYFVILKTKCLKFKSDIEMEEIKPREIIINI